MNLAAVLAAARDESDTFPDQACVCNLGAALGNSDGTVHQGHPVLFRRPACGLAIPRI